MLSPDFLLQILHSFADLVRSSLFLCNLAIPFQSITFLAALVLFVAVFLQYSFDPCQLTPIQKSLQTEMRSVVYFVNWVGPCSWPIALEPDLMGFKGHQCMI